MNPLKCPSCVIKEDPKMSVFTLDITSAGKDCFQVFTAAQDLGVYRY